MQVSDARAAYFTANGFSEAAYQDRWVKLQFGPMPFWIPNSPSRKRAIPLHDLHHIATGYATSLIGEAEIAAWEIGAGCKNYWAAWALDAGSFGMGLVLGARRTFRAFVRGRHTRSLYRTGWRDDLLGLSVAELRAELGLDRPAQPTRWTDVLAFMAWVGVVASPWLAAAILFALLR